MVKRKIEDWETGWKQAKTRKQQEQAIREYANAKEYNSRMRENERLNAPSISDKFFKAINKIKQLFGAKTKQAAAKQQKQY